MRTTIAMMIKSVKYIVKDNYNPPQKWNFPSWFRDEESDRKLHQKKLTTLTSDENECVRLKKTNTKTCEIAKYTYNNVNCEGGNDKLTESTCACERPEGHESRSLNGGGYGSLPAIMEAPVSSFSIEIPRVEQVFDEISHRSV